MAYGLAALILASFFSSVAIFIVVITTAHGAPVFVIGKIADLLVTIKVTNEPVPGIQVCLVTGFRDIIWATWLVRPIGRRSEF